MTNKKPKDKCSNCGDFTNFGNAIPERQKLKMCADCYKYYKSQRIQTADGRVFWRDGIRE